MTIHLNLENEEIYERFLKKYEEVIRNNDENFDLMKFIKEFKEEDNGVSTTK